MCKIFSKNLKIIAVLPSWCVLGMQGATSTEQGRKQRRATTRAAEGRPEGMRTADATERPQSDHEKFNKLLTVGKIPNIEGMSVEPLQRFNAENIDVGMTIHAPAC